MYGPHGQHGFFADYATDEYGFWPLVALVGGGTWLYGEEKEAEEKARAELARYGGGMCTMPGTGERLPCEEMKRRLCAPPRAPGASAEWCGSPDASAIAVESAALPQTTFQAIAQTLDPTTLFEHPGYLLDPEHRAELDEPKVKVPTWLPYFALVAVAGGVIWAFVRQEPG